MRLKLLSLLNKCYGMLVSIMRRTQIEKIGLRRTLVMWVWEQLWSKKWKGLDGLLVAFWSRKLSDAEKRYSIVDQEWLAVVDAVTRQWRHYLKGRKFVLRMDHSPLRQLLKHKGEDFSNRQLRWFERLYEFDFDIEHLSGVNNVAADALSRAYVVSALELGIEVKKHQQLGLEAVLAAVTDDVEYQGQVESIRERGSTRWEVRDDRLLQDGGG